MIDEKWKTENETDYDPGTRVSSVDWPIGLRQVDVCAQTFKADGSHLI
jgi:hypothetical protein